MNRKQLIEWAKTNGLTLGDLKTRSRSDEPGEREQYQEVKKGSKVIATVTFGEDDQVSGKSVKELYLAMGRPKDMPGIGRILVESSHAKEFFGDLGMNVEASKGDEVRAKTEDGTELVRYKGPMETEVLRSLACRCLCQLLRERELPAAEALPRFESAVANAAMSAEFGIPTEHLNPRETVAEALSMDLHLNPNDAVTLDAQVPGLGTIASLERLMDDPRAEKNGVFVSRTEYNARSTAPTGDSHRLRQVYNVYSSKTPTEPRLTVRLYERLSHDGAENPGNVDVSYRMSFQAIRDTARTVEHTDTVRGGERARESTMELLRSNPDKGRYEGYMNARGEPIKPLPREVEEG